jgi:hypothetical protein
MVNGIQRACILEKCRIRPVATLYAQALQADQSSAIATVLGRATMVRWCGESKPSKLFGERPGVVNKRVEIVVGDESMSLSLWWPKGFGRMIEVDSGSKRCMTWKAFHRRYPP